MLRLSCVLFVIGAGCGSSGAPPPDAGEAPKDVAADGAIDGTLEADAFVAPDVTAPDVLAADLAAPARLIIDKTMQAFEGITGCEGPPTAFTITNAGGSTSGASSVTVGEPFRAAADTCTGKQLPAGGSCSVSVAFNPASAGEKTATLSVTADPGGAVQAQLTGQAVPNDSLLLTPNTFDFGSVGLGELGKSASFELENIGGADLTIGEVTISTSNFLLTNNRCSYRLLQPGETCQVTVVYAPMSGGQHSALLSLPTTGRCGGAVARATLNGFATYFVGRLTISPQAVDFGDFCSSQPAIFHVSNQSQRLVQGLQVQVSSPSFAITGNGCTSSLAPGASCDVEVRPQRSVSVGKVSGALSVTGAAGESDAAALSLVSPGPTDTSVALSSPIPDTPVGQKSAPIELVLQNPAGAPSATFTWSLTNVAAAEYTVMTSDCNQPVPGGGSCRLHIVFAPTATGVRTASLILTAEKCPFAVAAVVLAGIGTAP
jgi:hypothetical protein